jgi:hypothetical protein
MANKLRRLKTNGVVVLLSCEVFVNSMNDVANR